MEEREQKLLLRRSVLESPSDPRPAARIRRPGVSRTTAADPRWSAQASGTAAVGHRLPRGPHSAGHKCGSSRNRGARKLKSPPSAKGEPVAVPLFESRAVRIIASIVLTLKKHRRCLISGKLRVLAGWCRADRKARSMARRLEETMDYIPALEMQVRVMTQLVQILSGLGADRSGSP
ncbi:uncharacterized protein A4U43_C05F1590 [Asparagus officinalis]|uniref:BHLH domain-containing protein n=1 Tax=Asparagus officinalis TaxID=4686 RepID=A0A5P1ENK7_ASPOF|nr:uncharacterized protein A4U43_C05F1590 [Asparagus officinalis]